jgi:hypothetical protein
MTEREPDDTQRRLALLHAARRAIAARAYAQGERLLHAALGEENRPVPADPLTFAVLRLLGESARKRGDLSRAAAVYREAQRLAVMLEMPGLESGAVEGLAMVARVNDDVPLAVDLLQRAARLAQRAGDGPGRAAVLSNLGEVLMKVGRLELVHLACHAVFHPRHAERSGILLAGEAGAETMDTWKLAALDWSSELTVLSACTSGQQQVRTGDEISGLARTLLASGVRSLIVALWSVPDLATTDGDERMIICAMSAIATAHRSAGHREEWLRWREAIQCRVTGRPFPRDIGHPRWEAQAALGAAPAYAAAPFADPRNWAAFVLISRG